MPTTSPSSVAAEVTTRSAAAAGYTSPPESKQLMKKSLAKGNSLRDTRLPCFMSRLLLDWQALG